MSSCPIELRAARNGRISRLLCRIGLHPVHKVKTHGLLTMQFKCELCGGTWFA